MLDSLMRIRSRAVGVLLLLALGSCGEDNKPLPAYADPCTTPMAGLLSCPAGTINPPVTTAADACRKLTDCGILAEKYLVSNDTNCSGNDECNTRGGTNECLANSQGQLKCHYHRLDYTWCLRQLTEMDTDPCPPSYQFSSDQVAGTIHCIDASACTVLGATFADKLRRNDGTDGHPAVATNDRYVCKQPNSEGKVVTVWTATICDAGLLSY
jgi:hypothetical protein